MIDILVDLVLILAGLAAFCGFLSWEQKRQWLREQTGWKPWIVYGGRFGNSPTYFSNEDAAVRHAYRWSLKTDNLLGSTRVVRGDQEIVCWYKGKVWKELGRKNGLLSAS
jgi:hypothetical protein